MELINIKFWYWSTKNSSTKYIKIETISFIKALNFYYFFFDYKNDPRNLNRIIMKKTLTITNFHLGLSKYVK